MNLTSDNLVSQKVLAGFSPGGIQKGLQREHSTSQVCITLKLLSGWPSIISKALIYLSKISTVHNLGKKYIVRHTFMVRNPLRLSVDFFGFALFKANFVIFFY